MSSTVYCIFMYNYYIAYYIKKCAITDWRKYKFAYVTLRIYAKGYNS